MHKNVRYLDNSGTLCHNTSLIVSITKFSIVIGFPCAFCHVSRDHVGVQPFSNWIPVIRTSITLALMAFPAVFPAVFKPYKSAAEVLNSEIYYRYD